MATIPTATHIRLLLISTLCLAGPIGCGRSLTTPEEQLRIRPSANPDDIVDSGVPDSGREPPPTRCGNDRLDPGEECDGDRLRGHDCTSIGAGTGPLSCRQCRFDRRECRPTSVDDCDNLVAEHAGMAPVDDRCLSLLCACDAEAFVECGPSCLELISCAVAHCDAGDLACISDNCQAWLTAGGTASRFQQCGALTREACLPTPGDRCGDGVLHSDELCDGRALDGQTCRSLGAGDGELQCSRSCTFDTSRCEDNARCGDSVLDPGEQCDGTADHGNTCGELGFEGGELGCNEDCSLYTGDCHRCGDGTIQAGEQCDGDDLAGLSCQRLGYSGGALACDGACTLDDSGCAVCGNDEVEAGETCDGDDLGAYSCDSLGFGSGTLSCHPSACRLDASGCSDVSEPSCGNGIAEVGEQCDGDDLASLECSDLGYDEGELACNAQTCRLNTADCGLAAPPDPIDDCAACGSESCAGAIESCRADENCIPGMTCLANMCGPDATLGCALQCFGGGGAGLLALTMFSCIVSECGPECVGAF